MVNGEKCWRRTPSARPWWAICRRSVEKLSDLRGADPHELAMRIDIALGRRHMNRQGLAALANLIELAEKS